MADEIVQYSRQAPFIETRSEQLLGSVFGIPNFQKQADETDSDLQSHFERIGESAFSAGS